MGIKQIVESLLNSLAAIAQTEETLKLSQPTPDLEAFLVASKAKVVNLKKEHDEASCLKSFTNTELEVLIERFHYVKLEYMRI